MRLHFPASLALALAAATSFAQSAQDKSVILSGEKDFRIF